MAIRSDISGRLLRLGWALAAAVALWSCGHESTTDADDRIAGATEAVATGDSSEAKQICDDLLASSSRLSATQLGHLSILYMQIGENDDMDDNTATAFQCYRNAFKADSIEAAGFYAAVSGENARYVAMLAALKQMIENPRRGELDQYDEHEQP